MLLELSLITITYLNKIISVIAMTTISPYYGVTGKVLTMECSVTHDSDQLISWKKGKPLVLITNTLHTLYDDEIKLFMLDSCELKCTSM